MARRDRVEIAAPVDFKSAQIEALDPRREKKIMRLKTNVAISLPAWVGAFAILVSVPALLAQSAIEIRNIDLSRSFAADSPLPKWEMDI